MYRFPRFVNTSIPSCIDIHKFHPNAPLPPRGTKARMASPVNNYDPRMERIGYRYPPACGFMPAAGFYGFAPGALRHTPIPVPFSFAPPGLVLAIVRSTVTNVATQKEKPPMALVGLTLGVGQFWNQYA
jgi:hypothetical protein